jgi:hypothetical protein
MDSEISSGELHMYRSSIGSLGRILFSKSCDIGGESLQLLAKHDAVARPEYEIFEDASARKVDV